MRHSYWKAEMYERKSSRYTPYSVMSLAVRKRTRMSLPVVVVISIVSFAMLVLSCEEGRNGVRVGY